MYVVRYFLCYRLKALDLVTMKKLDSKIYVCCKIFPLLQTESLRPSYNEETGQYRYIYVVRYFLCYRLKALDLVTMKKLDSKVNIIPVIAKADTITKAELQKFKQKVRA